jgi:2,3-bisphosphoglycerate-independent phosphoglycerate mutase
MPKDPTKRSKRSIVISRHGRYRFQTGMVTARLLQRGLGMEDAFAISNELRDQLRGTREITAEDLGAQIDAMTQERLGITAAELAQRHPSSVEADIPLVRTDSGHVAFSRAILLRQLITAGLEAEHAMGLAQETYAWLQGTEDPTQDQVRAWTSARVEELHGSAHARRYRFTCWVRQSEVPLILLIGGATGTGKSSLATELAFRLGIRMVTSTDMIRETMRTVLSPEVVPGLHDHSFRGMLQGGKALSDPRERVLAGFRQQQAQVAVGIRAVIRRAIRENSHMIIEGTHIRPPYHRLVTAGRDVMVAGLVLAVPEEKRHQERFPRRAQSQTMRSPDTYLEAFQSVRWIHDDLLAAAEDAGGVVVANDDLDITIRGVVDYLSQVLPFEEQGFAVPTEVSSATPEGPRTLFLILDGLGDEPNPALQGQTPLQAAATPTLDLLAGLGGLGQIMTTHNPEKAASTNEGLLALLGQPEMGKTIGRGLLEALGGGIPLAPGAVCFRGNMATIQADGILADRRAGRIRAGVEDLLIDLQDIKLPGGIRGRIFAGHEHRVIVVLQGAGLSSKVSDTDPGGEAMVQRMLVPEPLDQTPEAARTTDALQAMLQHARVVLGAHPLNQRRRVQGEFPANCIITRGAARIGDLPDPRHSPNTAALVSGCPTALGVARVVGMDGAIPPGVTGNLDTDVDAKFSAAAQLLEQREFVAIHIKGTDIAAHDRRPLEKRDFISRIDAALGRFLRDNPAVTEGLRVVVSADHGTSCLSGNHIPDPVPLLVATWSEEGEGEAAAFDEEHAAMGALGLLHPGQLNDVLWPEDNSYSDA